jgi:hypothetical protein
MERKIPEVFLNDKYPQGSVMNYLALRPLVIEELVKQLTLQHTDKETIP